MKRFIPGILTAALPFAVALVIAGCSNDIGPKTPGPAGFTLKENGAELVKEINGGAITGKIEIVRKPGTGAMTTPSGDLDVEFTNSDGSTWTTQTVDSVGISAYDDQVILVQRDASNKWRFKLLARGGGETGFLLTYFHNGAPIFTSHRISVSVVAQGLDVTKMQIFVPPSVLVTATDTVSGLLTVARGTELIPVTITFMNSRGEPVDVWSQPNVSLSWNVEDTTVVQFYKDEFDSTVVTMLPKTADTVNASFTLKQDSPTYGAYTVFASPEIKVGVH